MNHKSLAISLLAAVGLILFVTNPTKDKYAKRATCQLLDNASEVIIKQFCQENPLCIIAVERGSPTAKPFLIPIVNSTTTQNNFQFFSIYTTEVPGFKAVSIGILGGFIPIGAKVGFSQNYGFPIIF